MELQSLFKKVTVTVSGKVETINRSGVSRSGQAYHSFILKSKDLIYECLSFKEVAEKVMKKLEIGQSVACRGYYKDEFAKGSKIITLTFISINNENEQPIKQQTKQDVEDFKELTHYYESQGMVRSRYKGNDDNLLTKWARKDDCIFHEGVWKQHIEFVMDVLGVNEIKNRLYNNNINTTNIRGYKELLAKWVDEASLKILQSQDVKAVEKPEETYEFDYDAI